MSSTVLLSTAYFPPISWFAAILKNDKVILEACETYSRQTYRNRCQILGPNGLQSLSVPITKPYGNRTQTSEVQIVTPSAWNRLHWRAIVTTYNASPFFLYYRDKIELVLFEPQNSLFALNLSLIELLLELLEIEKPVSLSIDFEKDPKDLIDLRNSIHPKKAFLSMDLFPPYTQVFSTKFPFIPDLSIIDLLFNEGPASKDYLLNLSQKITQ
ncbi:MAG: WbqC family protein [Bacteroidales bacterium]|nr:WbqC family protein [Bacteroidales bacterium]